MNELANCIRFLAIDAIEIAQSGHPGIVMGMADLFTVLYSDFLRFIPSDPKWFNRDRLILSAGHGSMLLYATLYLTGYKDIDINDIKNFRKLGSRTPGHPEYMVLDGIETTTGPLGQGLANAVGMAIAAKMMAARFGDEVVNHKVYCVVSDGCLMEGISQEAMSLACHLNLNNLIIIFDDNGISIDGSTSLATSENNIERAKALGFNVEQINGHDHDEIHSSLSRAVKSEKPFFIAAKTTIGIGSPNKGDSNKAHGAPLGHNEVMLTRDVLGWKYDPFVIPNQLLSTWRSMYKRCVKDYNISLTVLESDYGKDYLSFVSSKDNILEKVDKICREFKKSELFIGCKNEATRHSFGRFLEKIGPSITNLVGGSADLTDSVCTKSFEMNSISKDNFLGNYIHYGVREHAMSAIMNGISLYGGFVPYGGTFLIFSDYMRPGMRMSAMMGQQVIYILTHDSIGLGEDGPTHQPVEQIHTLGCIPNMLVIRPCDSIETAEAFTFALRQNDTPSCIILTRQNVGSVRSLLPHNDNNMLSRGAYFIIDHEKPDCIIFASGSEVKLAIDVRTILEAESIAASVVSVPSKKLFWIQDDDYKEAILRHDISVRIGIEAGISDDMLRLIGPHGIFFGVESFGKSGTINDLFNYFGLNPKTIVSKIIKEKFNHHK